MKLNKTHKGLTFIEFEDCYGHKCSLQESSLVIENTIWFGIDDADPKCLVPGKGWQPVEFQDGTIFTTRMHLTQKQVKNLLPYLKKFVKTGKL